MTDQTRMVGAFLTGFGAGDSPSSDLAPPWTVLDFADVLAFLQIFDRASP